MPFSANTAYINTIPVDKQVRIPGDQAIEHRIRSYVRWNAMAMVVRANKHTNVGGHIASFASAATLYDTGFNHFWHAPSAEHGGDLVFVQGHSAPGVYARAHMLGRFTDEQMDNFRQEVDGKGVSSYPHPWLMPDFWQFPTVSMGLGPLMAIYQARFMKYLQDRGLAKTEGRKVWCFCGDGEMDEPESMGAIGMAARETLDNLIFVINCNLQRLDGPVRGNGKIIQELEAEFRGAGWNVIKVIWGSRWDPLLARDKQGILMRRMMECVDGEYQTFKSKDGAYVREYFFNTPELKALVADYSDEEIWNLNRGGHDPHKVYAAYRAAVDHKGQPTIILAKTIKGYGMGEAGEAQNITHQQKKMSGGSIRHFRDRFQIPVPDDKLDEIPYVKFPPGSAEAEYMKARRMELGGFLPTRRRKSASLAVPGLAALERFLKSTEDREISTTMAFVQILQTLLRDKNIGKHIVPIVPDESRTFGMEGMFRQLGIWNQLGQLYTPQDADQLMFYKESKDGQVLQEGINEPGAMCDWMAAATSYSTHGVPMIPFYIFYSMFGFQRVGDLAWAAGDMRCRGFLLGGTAGRTTLNGEGLQHEDGHSHVYAATIPNCVSYDPTLRLRAGRHHPGRAAPHVRRAAGRLLLPDGDERELRAAGDARRRRARHHQGHVPVQGRRRPRRRKDQGAACPAARLGRHPARSDRCGRAAQGRLGRRRRHLGLHLVHRARARRRSRVALEHDASDRPAARAACDGAARRHPGPGHCGDRLRARFCRADQGIRAAPLCRPRHRWLRSLRHARKAAPLFRGRPLVHHRRGAEGPGRRRHAARRQSGRGDLEIWHRRGESRAVDGLMRRRRRCSPFASQPLRSR